MPCRFRAFDFRLLELRMRSTFGSMPFEADSGLNAPQASISVTLLPVLDHFLCRPVDCQRSEKVLEVFQGSILSEQFA